MLAHQEREAALQNVVGKEMIDQKKAWIERCDTNKLKNGILIRRNDPGRKDRMEVKRQISCLAKAKQKEGVKGKTFVYSRKAKKTRQEQRSA